MLQEFQAGDFLIFQLESGFALLRVLDVEQVDGEEVWHVAAYKDFFLDADSADAALEPPDALGVEISHVALTNRAFESTQVAKLRNVPLRDEELERYRQWKSAGLG